VEIRGLSKFFVVGTGKFIFLIKNNFKENSNSWFNAHSDPRLLW